MGRAERENADRLWVCGDPMRKQGKSALDKYLDDDWACAYENRIPKGWSSRDLAFLPILCGILFGGMGVFMAHDAAMEKVLFWSNPVVLLGVGFALYANLLGLAMYFSRWQSTAIQSGLVTLSGMPSSFYAFSGASLADILLYGSAPFEIKALLFIFSLAWNGYWAYMTIRGCQAIWADESLRRSVWVNYRDAVVYRRSGAKAAIEQKGIQIHPNNLTLILAVLLITPLVWWQKDLSAIFGVPFVHVFLALFGQFAMAIACVFTVLSFMMMIYYPLKIRRATGKIVLFDMAAPTKAPVPDQPIRGNF